MSLQLNFINPTKALIDNLKAVCANYGLGNDGNEFKIITQVFLYKFMNDKFRYEAKKHEPKLAKAENFQQVLEDMPPDEYQFLMARIGPDVPKLFPKEMEELIGKYCYFCMKDNTKCIVSKLMVERLQDYLPYSYAVLRV